jgi:hypothetical protein
VLKNVKKHYFLGYLDHPSTKASKCGCTDLTLILSFKKMGSDEQVTEESRLSWFNLHEQSEFNPVHLCCGKINFVITKL